MPTQIITGDNASEATFSGASDGTFAVRVGPNGAKVTAIAAGATGSVDVLGQLTQQGGAVVPRMLLMTAQATTSGTFVDFTGIPSWAKKITVMLNGVSTNGVSIPLIQCGSGTIQTTGYSSGSTTGTSVLYSTAGFIVDANHIAASLMMAIYTIAQVSGSSWVCSGNLNATAAAVGTHASGGVTISGTLDRIRLTTANGTDLFDAGSVNILIEGY